MQAALTRDIQETMRAWVQQLQECALVFVHAPAANAGPLFQGEAPPLSRGDPRVRSVPFTTQRPTFSETKRVAQLLLAASPAEAPQAAAPPPAGVLCTAATAISVVNSRGCAGCTPGICQPEALAHVLSAVFHGAPRLLRGRASQLLLPVLPAEAPKALA